MEDLNRTNYGRFLAPSIRASVVTDLKKLEKFRKGGTESALWEPPENLEKPDDLNMLKYTSKG